MKQGSKRDIIIFLSLPLSFSEREGVCVLRRISEFYSNNLFQLLAACYTNHLSKIICQGDIFTVVKTMLDLSFVRSIYNKLSWYVKPIWICEIVYAPKLFHLLIRKIVCWVFHLSIGEREVILYVLLWSIIVFLYLFIIQCILFNLCG